jgi:heme/copper-type cytochrome/quinol oxidase subunit 3
MQFTANRYCSPQEFSQRWVFIAVLWIFMFAVMYCFTA